MTSPPDPSHHAASEPAPLNFHQLRDTTILLAIPFFWPILADKDFGLPLEDVKVWFGILALIVVELGLITPPVGLNVFIIHGLAQDVPIGDTFRGVLPFFLAELARVALLIAFPAIVLFVPYALR